MSGSASDPFFWNDWQGDPLLRLCSLAAQGLWMRLLCIAAESTKKGYVLINGRNPTEEEVARIAGCTALEVKTLVDEIERNGVCSRTRHGIVYCRRMVKQTKKQAASRKGGKIGGRVTLENHKGIFSTQGATQDDTHDGTQHPRRAPLPSPIPYPEEKERIKKANGHGAGTTTIQESAQRIARFQQTIAQQLGPTGWETVVSACTRSDPQHEKALALCMAAAVTLGKGWPHAWPVT